MSTWADGQGVIEFPDGVCVRGRGLLYPLPSGELPEFGVYLLGEPPPAMAWESVWLRWPDFRTPSDRDEALSVLIDAHQRAHQVRVELACKGGRGRTGTALSCLAVLSGIPAAEAVAYVRRHHHPHAVETPFQRRYVRQFESSLAGHVR